MSSRFDVWLGRIIWSVFFCDFIVAPLALAAVGLWFVFDPGAVEMVSQWMPDYWDEG